MENVLNGRLEEGFEFVTSRKAGKPVWMDAKNGRG
jgi:hypothetical protein